MCAFVCNICLYVVKKIYRFILKNKRVAEVNPTYVLAEQTNERRNEYRSCRPENLYTSKPYHINNILFII